MKIYYDSKTGNVNRFIEKLKVKMNEYNIDCTYVKIDENVEIDDANSHLITYTTKIGQVPEITKNFLINNYKKRNIQKLKSVSSSGNMNWGQYFGVAADKIATKFGLKSIFKFELSGTAIDIEKYIKVVTNEE